MINQSFSAFLSVTKLSGSPKTHSSTHKLFYSTAAPNVLSIKQFGNPEKVVTLERTKPTKLENNAVRVSMKAAPINPIDIAMIEGRYPTPSKKPLPLVGGIEGVGIISELSSSSSKLKVGDWVIPRRPGSFGTWSEEVIVSEKDVVVVPQTIPIEYAACLSVAPTTAYLLLKKFADLKEGDVIIQNGANGMVGQTIFQLAALKGIKSINIIRHREVREYGELVERMKYYGAHLVVADNYLNTPDYHQLVSDLPRPSVAFDCVGGHSATEMARLVKEGGTLVSYSSYNHGFGTTFPTSSFIFNDLNVRGFWLENWYKKASDDEISNVYNELTSLISSSLLRFWLETYHISEHPFAFPRMEQKKDRKIVFTF